MAGGLHGAGLRHSSTQPYSAFHGSRLAGTTATTSSSRWVCADRHRLPRKKDNLLAVAEQHFLRALERPLEGLSFSIEDFAAALSKHDYSFEVGQTVEGVVISAGRDGAQIDIGAKAPAYLPTVEASLLNLKNVKDSGLTPGWRDKFQIIRGDDGSGALTLGLKSIQSDLSWERCRELQAENAVVNGLVCSENRGGLVVNIEGLQGFVPFSQLASRTIPGQLIDKFIPLKFLDVDKEQLKLTLSHKKALIATQSASLTVGSVVEGVVASIMSYGAFINVGGLTGLLHISEISHQRLSDINSILQPGDKLKVMVLKIDSKKGRIALSTKKLESTPGDMLSNPSLVYEMAEKTGKTFQRRLAQAEAAIRTEKFQKGGISSFNHKSVLERAGSALEQVDLGAVPAVLDT